MNEDYGGKHQRMILRCRVADETLQGARKDMVKSKTYESAVAFALSLAERDAAVADMRGEWKVIEDPVWELVA